MFSQIPALEKPSVHIKDPDKVESVINSMIQDGAEHLQVLHLGVAVHLKYS